MDVLRAISLITCHTVSLNCNKWFQSRFCICWLNWQRPSDLICCPHRPSFYYIFLCPFAEHWYYRMIRHRRNWSDADAINEWATYNKFGRDRSPMITDGAKLRFLVRVCKVAGVMQADGRGVSYNRDEYNYWHTCGKSVGNAWEQGCDRFQSLIVFGPKITPLA